MRVWAGPPGEAGSAESGGLQIWEPPQLPRSPELLREEGGVLTYTGCLPFSAQMPEAEGRGVPGVGTRRGGGSSGGLSGQLPRALHS